MKRAKNPGRLASPRSRSWLAKLGFHPSTRIPRRLRSRTAKASALKELRRRSARIGGDRNLSDTMVLAR